ncbi:MAG: globin domain-containing protein [Paracoccaceae bacterium]|nr:globin domain-containing protein [Paracoccaceae bacterium]
MIMTEKQIALIRESRDQLTPELEETSAAFYEDLFRRAPELRALFRDDLSGQGMRFMSAVSVIADNLDDPAQLDDHVSLLAEGHAQFGIEEPAYRAMEEALIHAFANALGDQFTSEVEHAWRSAFRQVSDQMRVRGATLRSN